MRRRGARSASIVEETSEWDWFYNDYRARREFLMRLSSGVTGITRRRVAYRIERSKLDA
jgi:hypothetical protein